MQQVLVENVADHVGVTAISLPAVEEEKGLEILKPPNRIIRRTNSLITFIACQTNPNVGFCNHIDIICTISNSQSDLIRFVLLDQLDDLGLLFWGEATGDDDFAC